MATVFGISNEKIECFWEDESGKMYGKGVNSNEFRVIKTLTRKPWYYRLNYKCCLPKSVWTFLLFVLLLIVAFATVVGWLEDEEDYMECVMVRVKSLCRRKSVWKANTLCLHHCCFYCLKRIFFSDF